MLVGELARLVGRSVDTVKRWEAEGLLTCDRDDRGRRCYDASHVEVCQRLANLGVLAQFRSEKLRALADREPVQLDLLVSPDVEKKAV